MGPFSGFNIFGAINQIILCTQHFSLSQWSGSKMYSDNALQLLGAFTPLQTTKIWKTWSDWQVLKMSTVFSNFWICRLVANFYMFGSCWNELHICLDILFVRFASISVTSSSSHDMFRPTQPKAQKIKQTSLHHWYGMLQDRTLAVPGTCSKVDFWSSKPWGFWKEISGTPCYHRCTQRKN